jgi:uroporphyrinogen III methyltransferase/synthase
VGAGPGDPGLITARGLRLLRTAEVLVYDRLVDPALIAEVPDSAELLFARGEPQGRPDDQEEINGLLIDHARRGRLVVRLKGGDPFLFGRGGEEADALAAAGIPFEVVPGVSSALAVPAYAGIPVTDRRYASSLRVLTGNTGETDRGAKGLPEKTPEETIVALMAVRRLPDLVDQLRADGWPEATPVALIERGTTSRQRTLNTTLGEAVRTASEQELSPPAITVVGRIVEIRDRIAWFERKRLFGLRVLVTRARSQAQNLRQLLSDEGAEAVVAPSIEFQDPPDWSSVDRSIEGFGRFEWIAFTSRNGVFRFLQRMWHHGADSRSLAGIKIATVGPMTAAALESHGVLPDLAAGPTAADLASALAMRMKPGDRVLHPRGESSEGPFADWLSESAEVTGVTAYRTIAPDDLRPNVERALRLGIDAALFASPSAVTNLVDVIGADSEQLSKSTIICIGPVTSAAARNVGLNVTSEAREPSDQGLVDALVSVRTQ